MKRILMIVLAAACVGYVVSVIPVGPVKKKDQVLKIEIQNLPLLHFVEVR